MDVNDVVMSVPRHDGDVLGQMHDAFTVRYAGTGIEVHGLDGSIVAEDVMTQEPIRTVILRDSSGERQVNIPDRRDMYEVALNAFARAVEEKTDRTVTGVDGVGAPGRGTCGAGGGQDERPCPGRDGTGRGGVT